MMGTEQEACKIDGSSRPASITRSICPIRDGKPNTHEQQSLSAVKQLLETTERDLLIEGRLSLLVDVSIERSHQYQRDEATGKARLVLGKGWFVSIGLPSRATLSADAPPFGDGEPQMQCDLHYAGEEGTITLDDAIRALGIDTGAKIWTISKAP